MAHPQCLGGHELTLGPLGNLSIVTRRAYRERHAVTYDREQNLSKGGSSTGKFVLGAMESKSGM
jgi:hypothetical protein